MTKCGWGCQRSLFDLGHGLQWFGQAALRQTVLGSILKGELGANPKMGIGLIIVEIGARPGGCSNFEAGGGWFGRVVARPRIYPGDWCVKEVVVWTGSKKDSRVLFGKVVEKDFPLGM